MITTDSIRRLLAIADVARDPYAVADSAASLLTADSQDRTALEHYVRALGALKLTAVAGRATGGNGESAGGGMIPWASRARRFAANLRSLEHRTASGAALVQQAAAELTHYELHQAADGNFQVLDPRQPLQNAWLGNLAPHKNSTGLLQFNRQELSMPRPIAFDGLGYGWLFTHFLEQTANSFLNYSCAVYVFESDPLSLAMVLHMHDLQAEIASPRTRWFIGASPHEVLTEFRTAVNNHPTWTIPDSLVRCVLRQRPALDLQPLFQELQGTHTERRRALVEANERYYAGKDQAYWHARFNEALDPLAPPDRRLRVMGITSRYTTVLQHAMAELQAAVGAAGGGAVMDMVMEPDDQSLESPFVERIAAFKPDLIVVISRMRYENPNLPRNAPFLTWDQDNLPCMRTPQATASLTENPLTFVAGNGAIFGYGHLNWPERSCIFCHSAGAAHRYSAEPVAPNLLAPHTCDISYVSNASGTPQSLAAQLRKRYQDNDRLGHLFDAATQAILTRSDAGACWDDIALQTLIRDIGGIDAANTPQEGVFHELTMDLHRFADRCYRHATLAWVSRWCAARGKSLRLYGRGWESHPDLARWAAGPANPGEQMRAIYQASRINLQLIESGFIHSRSLDGLAAGGFFLTRHAPADGEDPATLRDIHLLGKWVLEHRIATPAELEDKADAVTLARWKAALAHHPWPPAHAIRVLKVWAHTPMPVVAFPMLPEISFRGEAAFGALAERYLGDADARQAIAREMRQIVLEQFSYASRWNQFSTHIARALAPGT